MSLRLSVAAVALALLQLLSTSTARAQGADSTRQVRVFLDCHVSGCDDEYFRREIQFVDHMRDRADASVHVLVTAEPTGGAGTAYTLNFIGLREMAALSDTIRFTTPNSATQDERRVKLAKYLKLGLVRYAVRSGGTGERIAVTYSPSTTTATQPSASADRWNYWVFRTRANAYMNGEKSSKSLNLYGSQSANRITRDWKTTISLNQSYSEDKYSFDGGGSFSSYSHSNGLSELVVKSLTPHLSAGQTIRISSSSYLNEKLVVRAAPAIEYDLFPYEESSRRQLTIQYSLGVNHFRYEDTTIFDKITETRPDQSISLGLGFKQPWGSISTQLSGKSYLNDYSKNRLDLYSSADVRLFKGLSFNFYVSASRVRDQFFLAKAGATEQEVLLRRRQLATSYSYFAGFGLSYTFGSIFNNVVNTRFDPPSD